jgi:hypothetical protein
MQRYPQPPKKGAKKVEKKKDAGPVVVEPKILDPGTPASLCKNCMMV